MNKVFRHKHLETRQLEPPTYKFMTDDQLKEAFEAAAKRANNMLQMPPVIQVQVLSLNKKNTNILWVVFSCRKLIIFQLECSKFFKTFI